VALERRTGDILRNEFSVLTKDRIICINRILKIFLKEGRVIVVRIYPYFGYGDPMKSPFIKRGPIVKKKKDLVEKIKPVSSTQKVYNDLKNRYV